MPSHIEDLARVDGLQTVALKGPDGTAELGTARPMTSTERLRSLRLAIYADVMRGIPPGPVRVAQYALVRPGQDPADRLARTQALVTRETWNVAMTTFDDTGMTDPATRPQLARLYAAIRHGELHGIVATSRTDFSTFHDIYEDALTDIRVRGGFLALVCDETTL
ncbi:hypothetical protein [Streptomyces sp. NPDC021212]|uniref:hypothetical protein n=1 Tax=Streptomyces sp. NPDC021212 TaxID=3365118 RepID=UPI00378AC3D3